MRVGHQAQGQVSTLGEFARGSRPFRCGRSNATLKCWPMFQRKRRLLMNDSMRGWAVTCLLLAVLAGGCSSGGADREAKREHDRTMMRLNEAEKDRANYKMQ